MQLTVDQILADGRIQELHTELNRLKEDEKHGFIDPRIQYCLATGRPCGQLRDDVLFIAMASCPDSFDIEEIIDELTTRALINMKPSIAWQSRTPVNQKNLIDYDPVGSLVYFICAAFEPTTREFRIKGSAHAGISADWLSLEHFVRWNAQRVKMFNLFNTEAFALKPLRKALRALVRLDGLVGLRSIKSPKLNYNLAIDLGHANYFLDELCKWALETTKKEVKRLHFERPRTASSIAYAVSILDLRDEQAKRDTPKKRRAAVLSEIEQIMFEVGKDESKLIPTSTTPKKKDKAAIIAGLRRSLGA